MQRGRCVKEHFCKHKVQSAFRCSELGDLRQDIHSQFWDLSDDSKSHFLAKQQSVFPNLLTQTREPKVGAVSVSGAFSLTARKG